MKLDCPHCGTPMTPVIRIEMDMGDKANAAHCPKCHHVHGIAAKKLTVR